MHFRPIGKTKLMALCSIRHAAAIGIAIAPPAPNSGFVRQAAEYIDLTVTYTGFC